MKWDHIEGKWHQLRKERGHCAFLRLTQLIRPHAVMRCVANTVECPLFPPRRSSGRHRTANESVRGPLAVSCSDTQTARA